MLGFSTFAALLPQLRDLWGLSNSAAGTIGGMFFGGYVATVSLWTALTDRIDGRKVYLTGCLIAAAGCAGFGLAASGFASAVLFQALIGAGIAATYMPGLRLLSDRISGPNQSRYIAFYTSFFGIGTALSLVQAGAVATLLGWRAAFLAAAMGPLAAGALVMLRVGYVAPPRRGEPFSFKALFPIAAWRKVLAIRAAAGYTLGYAVHCIELFASRAWMVAFLGFSSSFHGAATFPWHATAIAAVMNLVSVPASIFGNEAALRVGRRRWILFSMTVSGATGILVGLAAPWHWGLVLAVLAFYSMMVMAESATLTAGLVGAAPAELRGAAMGLYSLAGFGGAMLGPVMFGAALDAAGGSASHLAWVIAYAAIGAGCLTAPAFARLFSRRV